MKSLRCPYEKCFLRTNPSFRTIIRYGSYQTWWGRRRRFRCNSCGKTFCWNSRNVYHRLHHRRKTFDEVARLSVEGVNKSAIARIQQIAWNTVDRWLEKAAKSCRRFDNQKIRKIFIRELQADEIRSVVGGKNSPLAGPSFLSTCGRDFGLRPSSENAATETLLAYFKMFLAA